MLGQATTVETTDRDLLLLSDVHLGADLKREDLRRAGSLEALARNDMLDRALGAFLDDYAARAPVNHPWRLILNGDLVDFIGINLTPRDCGLPDEFNISADEELYGLEPGPERCAFLMQLVVLRHPHFFQRLAAFLNGGHELLIIRGNHDAAFFWPEVQRIFVAGLVDAGRTVGLTAEETAKIGELVRFEDWFYLEPGRIYVEHGHVHDELCADPGMRPTELRRPDRLGQPLSTLTLRYFANRFPTLDLDNVDQWTAWQFIRWACVTENPFRVGCAFVETSVLLLLPPLRRWLRRVRRAKVSEAHPAEADEVTGEIEIAENVRARLAQGVQEAERFASGVAQLVRRTAQTGVRDVLQMLYLDRAATMGFGAVMGAGCMTLSTSWGLRLAIAAGIVVAVFIADKHLQTTRRVSVGPKLRTAADNLARLIDVPLVVMGHSHKPVDTTLADGHTRYINLGSWLGAARPGIALSLGLPHLVVHGADAQFLRWHPKA